MFFLLVFGVFCSCFSTSNSKVNQENLIHIKFTDTVTSSGIYFRYKNVNGICCLEVGNPEIHTIIPYYGKVEKIDKIPGCAIYAPYWISNKVLVAFNGCGNFFTNSDLFLFHKDSVERQRYGHIEGFDGYKRIAYLDNNTDDFLIIKDVFSGKKDSLFFELFVSEEALQNAEEYTTILEGLEAKYNGETIHFKGDTIFFSFLGKDTFHLMKMY